MNYDKIVICLDMAGCPNRCKHCWVGHWPNGKLTEVDLRYVADQFRPYTACLIVDDWYREPDYRDNYREMWELCQELSDEHEEHYELASFWRLVRDESYADWLVERGVKKVQLTLFGGREKTDYYVGRRGAYDEILKSIDILLEHKLVPRIQFFVNQDTVVELSKVEKLIDELRLEERCRALGEEFVFFMHQGGCDGENEQFYDIWITPKDIKQLPKRMVDWTLKHFEASNLDEVFGRTEEELYNELITDTSTRELAEKEPVFFVDQYLNVYPNRSTPRDYWCLGNLTTDGIETILKNYAENKSPAQQARLTVPICDIVKKVGNPKSQRLFTKGDYVDYVLNQYCKKK